MKKAGILIAAFAATAMMTINAGCSGGNTQMSSNTPSAPETTEKITEKTTEKPTEPPTEKPTEVMTNTVYQAYLDYMQGHPEWFLADDETFSYAMKKKPIAFRDINGDGIEEIIHYRPKIEEKSGKINLCIVTYNNGVQTLYDEEEVSIGKCTGTIGQAQTGSEDYVELCQWYDADQGLQYSLSVYTTDVDGLDLAAVAEQVYKK